MEGQAVGRARRGHRWLIRRLWGSKPQAQVHPSRPEVSAFHRPADPTPRHAPHDRGGCRRSRASADPDCPPPGRAPLAAVGALGRRSWRYRPTFSPAARGVPTVAEKRPVLPATAARGRPSPAGRGPPIAAASLPIGCAPRRSNLIMAARPGTAVPAPACSARARLALAHGRRPQSKTPAHTGSHCRLSPPHPSLSPRTATAPLATHPTPPHPVPPPLCHPCPPPPPPQKN